MKLTTKLLTVMAIALDESLERTMDRDPHTGSDDEAPEGTRPIHLKRDSETAKEILLIEQALEWVEEKLLEKERGRRERHAEKIQD